MTIGLSVSSNFYVARGFRRSREQSAGLHGAGATNVKVSPVPSAGCAGPTATVKTAAKYCENESVGVA